MDPAIFLASNSVLGLYFPLRTACLLKKKKFLVCIITSLSLSILKLRNWNSSQKFHISPSNIVFFSTFLWILSVFCAEQRKRKLCIQSESLLFSLFGILEKEHWACKGPPAITNYSPVCRKHPKAALWMIFCRDLLIFCVCLRVVHEI